MKVKTKEEWQALVEKLKSSGLTKSEFCRRNQIASSRFYDWAKEYGGGIIPPSSLSKKVKTPKKISKFIEIELEKPSIKSGEVSLKTLRIITSYGATLEIPL